MNFLKVQTPFELKIINNTDATKWTLDTNIAQLNNHPFVKTRKWVVRCICKFFELYGRPAYVDENKKKFAQYFVSKYSKTFMELIYFNILCKYSQKQEFVYYKTLHSCIKYVQLACHFGQLFKLLCENNCQYLNDLIFNCLFSIICLTPKELTMFEQNPQQYIKQSLSCMLANFVVLFRARILSCLGDFLGFVFFCFCWLCFEYS